LNHDDSRKQTIKFNLYQDPCPHGPCACNF
jgi:hypothetical protein